MMAIGYCASASSRRRLTLSDTGLDALRANRSLPALNAPITSCGVRGADGSVPAAIAPLPSSMTNSATTRNLIVIDTPAHQWPLTESAPGRSCLNQAIP
jgi:hypothetical protein